MAGSLAPIATFTTATSKPLGLTHMENNTVLKYTYLVILCHWRKQSH